MKFEDFEILAKKYNVIPVYEKITGDMLTPVLAYLKIRDKNSYSFLLESVEGIGRMARYSLLGKNPVKIIKNKRNNLTITGHGYETETEADIFGFLKAEISSHRYARIDDLPDFTGGIIGYLGYENISLIENVINFDNIPGLGTPDSILGLYDTVIVFDHYKHQLIIISNVILESNTIIRDAFNIAKEKIRKLKDELASAPKSIDKFKVETTSFSNMSDEKFTNLVERCKEDIHNGEVFQIVLSKRYSSDYSGDLLNVYRALRMINPSPYMYFLEFGDDFTIIGTSPEDLLKVKNRKAAILPIAGTRRRGKTIEEDIALEKDLLNDPKEIAEHTMLVDLARNDLGRICKFNSIKVIEKMQVQRYSHVMHIVSRVEGELADDKDCIDALRAGFPAGTVTGAPKIRAVQLLNEYEQLERNVYAGALGYIDFSGNMDLCIAIRTLFAKGNKIHWQAGAGIVADSKPELESKEITNKSAVMLNALNYAEVLDENSGN